MYKHLFLFLACVASWTIMSQDLEVRVLYSDTFLGDRLSPEIVESTLWKIYDGPINNGYVQDTEYWFKIEGLDKGSVVQTPNNHIKVVTAYQNQAPINFMPDERFRSFRSRTSSPLFLHVKPTKEHYIPLDVYSAQHYKIHERNQFLIIGFYYGFSMVLFIINLFYFLTLKEETFLYYAGFLLTISFGLILSDGILEFYDFSLALIQRLQAIDHVLVTVFAYLFAISYLRARNYFKYVDHFFIGLLILQCAFCTLYIATFDFLYYIWLELVVFFTLSSLWFTGVLLFSKNWYTKIFTIAYIFILILGIDYFVLKLFGIKCLEINGIHVKLGGVIEMLFLSYAVVYRIKIIRSENKEMRASLDMHLNEIASLSQEIEKLNKGEENVFTAYELSFRESEILQFISTGKSNKEIAEALHISINTVKYHVKNIYEKLNIKNRKEAVAKVNLV